MGPTKIRSKRKIHFNSRHCKEFYVKNRLNELFVLKSADSSKEVEEKLGTLENYGEKQSSFRQSFIYEYFEAGRKVKYLIGFEDGGLKYVIKI